MLDDLNYLLMREQEELIRYHSAHTPEISSAHRRSAADYNRRIRQHPHPYRSERADGSASFTLSAHVEVRA
ncbi:MAG: hypothetical protein CMN61_09400 [Sphingobium sp.]|nr:hypothetical protein [Sphingobium sp.]MAP45899.1 hypothetical protein [Sphingobium sp.]MBA38640.1 hypothetical protein [Sphingobium sp.]MBS49302.1 hypothetical protein [Sphingobium sp.]HCW60848.1 hypothetical protein [Sphingobium sp.]